MTEMEYDIKMTLLDTQQSLVVFLEQLGAETNDLNSIFKKAIIKTVLSFFLFSFLFIILIIMQYRYHYHHFQYFFFVAVSEKGLFLLLEQS